MFAFRLIYHDIFEGYMMKKALIITVGSPGGIHESLADRRADKIYFIVSEDSKKNIPSVIENLKDLAGKSGDDSLKDYVNNFNEDVYDDSCLIEDVDDITESFFKCLNLINKLKKDYKIDIDFTGGTRTMGTGLYLAAINEDCDSYYVSGERVDNIGIVSEGSEEVKLLKNPFKQFAVREFNRGIQFFNNYQFYASLINFKTAYAILEDEYLKERVALLIDIVNFYYSWDKFSNKLIIDSEITRRNLNDFLQNEIIYKIDNNPDLNNFFREGNPQFYKQLKLNKEFLDKKISSNSSELFNDIKVYVPDLLNNAERRIIEGKYDDAVARLYRATELIAQLQLKDLKYVVESDLNNDLKFTVDMPKLFASDEDYKLEKWNLYNNKKRNWYKHPAKRYQKPIMGLQNLYILLSYLDEKSRKLSGNFSNKIYKPIQDRNNSILAHGLNPIDEKLAKILYKRVLEHSLKLYDDIQDNMGLAKFPHLESN